MMNKKHPKKPAKARMVAEPTAPAPDAISEKGEPAGLTPEPFTGRGFQRLAAVLFLAALALSLYLLKLSLAGEVAPGCGAQGGCDEILNSRWSSVYGLPVSLPGGALYAFLLVSALWLDPSTRAHRRLEAMASVAVVAGALWFFAVQAFVLKSYCPWCCAAHALAIVGVLALWWARRFRAAGRPSDPVGLGWLALPMVAVAGVAVAQTVAPSPARSKTTALPGTLVAAGKTVTLHGGQIVLDPAALPVIGLPEAPLTTVALTDFTCPHCLALHRTLNQLAADRPGQFRTVLMPAAFDPAAREVHRLLLAAWRLDPARHREMTAALVDGSLNPDPQALTARLRSQFGETFHERAWGEAQWIEETMRLGDTLLKLNAAGAGSNTLPQLMIGDRLITGPATPESLAALLEAGTGGSVGTLPPPVAALSASSPTPPVVPTTGVPEKPAGVRPALTTSDPVIRFESTTIDLGKVPKGSTASKTISFTNAGGAPLTLKAIKAGCGCTTVQGWEQTVAPGQQGRFEIKLDTTNFAGPLIKTIDVESNASNARVKLDLKVDVWTPVRLTPTTVSFGNVLKGTTVTPKEIEVTVTDPEPLHLVGVRSLTPYFKATLEPVEPGRRYRLTVAVPELGDRAQNGELRLDLGHPKLQDMKISAFINPIDPVVVQPRQVVVPAAALVAGTKSIVSVYCHDTSVPILEVTDLAYSGGEGVTVVYEKKATERWGRVVMTFPAGYTPPAEGRPILSFRTNHPRVPEVKIPVQFMAPRPAVAPGTGK